MTSTRAPIVDVEPAVALRRWLPGMVLLGLIWGSSFLFIKVGVSALPPLYVSLGRVASGALTLVIVLAVLRARLPRDRGTWLHNAVVATVGVAAPFTLFAYGEERIPSLLAGLWNATTPLVVLPMAVFVFRTERLTARKGLGLLLGFLGALIILGIWQGVGGASLSGQLMCLAAAACYGVAIPYTKRFVAPRPHSGLVMSAVQLLLATVLLAVLAPLITDEVPDVRTLPAEVIASVVTLGAVGTGLAFVLHMRNIRLVGATTASMVTYIIPVFATVVGVVVLHEHLSWYQPVGALVVLAGVAISQGVSLRPQAAGPASTPQEPLPVCSGENTDADSVR